MTTPGFFQAYRGLRDFELFLAWTGTLLTPVKFRFGTLGKPMLCASTTARV